MGLNDFTFYDVIARNAKSFRNKEAWFEADDNRTITFSQYKENVDRLAMGLQKLGIEKGDRIGVLGKNSLEYFLLYGAAAALGAIMLPINWRLVPDEVKFNLNDGQPKLMFVDREFTETVQALKDKLLCVERYFSLGPGSEGFSSFGTLLNNPADFEPGEVSMDDGFVIVYTAAVAGRPRGALLSHGNILWANMHFDYLCNIMSEDVHLNLLPFFHAGGLLGATSSFHAGALNVNMSKFDAATAMMLIQEKRVSFIINFSPILSLILEQHEKTGMNIRSLRAVVGLETTETIEKYQKVTGGTYYCIYGQTETSCVATLSVYNERPGSAGKMLPLAEVKLLDNYDRPIPTGQVGEIAVKGPMVFKGYWNLPKDTEYTFRDGWHHTGDLGRFDDDGFLWYAGRKIEKELIKPGGENVYPAEVEKVILKHPAVQRTVVFGVPDPKWKEAIKAVCQLKEGQNLDPEELIEFVGERIARYKRPRYVSFVTDFPILEDGSPDRSKIKELYGGDA
jgi:acyl-CoA synthetase (AMP-forming)/AMP-acid ligase II